MKPTMSPQEVADNYGQGAATRGVANFKKRVMQVTENPMAKAAQKADKMLAGITESVTSGRWAAGLNKGTLQTWQAQTASKGGANYATGTAAGKSKMLAYRNAAGPAIAQARQTVANMPNDTAADRIARMVKMAELMAALKGQYKQ